MQSKSKFIQTQEEYKELEKRIAQINTGRGGENGLKGFYFEAVNATEHNIDNIENGKLVRERVIDDNGLADAEKVYSNGSIGRQIQYKCVNDYYAMKNFIVSGKYDGQILIINSDNPLLTDSKQLEKIYTTAREHNIKIIVSKLSSEEMEKIATFARFEGKVRSSIGLEQNAPITAKTYVTTKETNHYSQIAFGAAKDISTRTVDDAIVPIMIVGIEKVIDIVTERENVDEAVNDFSDLSKRILIGSLVKSTTEYVVESVDSLEFVRELIEPECLGIITSSGVFIAEQIVLYSNGEISEEQIFSNIKNKGIDLALKYVLKGVTYSTGIVVSLEIFLVKTACKYLITTIKSFDNYKKNIAICSSILQDAQREIKKCNELIMEVNENYISMLDASINISMNKIYLGIVRQDNEVVESGLNKFLKTAGCKEKVVFSGMSDEEVKHLLFSR